MTYFCPVCGYPELNEPPRDSDNNPSYEVCLCCGFEFGFDDDSEDKSYEKYRTEWINDGAKWFTSEKKPNDWKLSEQLNNIEIDRT